MKKAILFIAFTLLCTMVKAGDDSRADSKIAEITEVVPLGMIQKATIKKAYIRCLDQIDSAKNNVKDKADLARIKYAAKKTFHEALIKTLTTAQITQYVKSEFAPEVQAKTDYRISLLKETSEYTEAELKIKEKEIYNYLMLEKIVYFRDKYDIAKQKNNISRLKQVQPTSLKESNNIEKQKGYGKFVLGKIKW